MPGEPAPADDATAAADSGGQAFTGLWQAAVRAAEEAAAVAQSGDDIRALRCVVALDQALAGISQLASAVPGVLQAAFPGAAVETVVRQKLAAADRMAAVIRSHQAQLDELTAAEDRLRQMTAEYEDLRQRVTELRRLERAAEVLPRLGEFRDLIEERVAALSAPVAAAESGLARAAETLAPLDEDALSRLSPRVRELTRRAADCLAAVASAEVDLAEQERRLADAMLRERELTELREHGVEALAQHARADRAVLDAIVGPMGAAALSGELDAELTRMRDLLAGIDAQLEDVDRVLGRALTARSDLMGRLAAP